MIFSLTAIVVGRQMTFCVPALSPSLKYLLLDQSETCRFSDEGWSEEDQYLADTEVVA